MPLPITPESIEQFAMAHLERAKNTDDAQQQELRHDWAFGAALLLQQHRYYDHSARIFDKCEPIRQAIYP